MTAETIQSWGLALLALGVGLVSMAFAVRVILDTVRR